MTEKLRLSKRLSAIADLAAGGSGVIDVGTDHGYLPVYFAQSGRYCRIVASDIGSGPLKSAMASARNYGVSDQIEFILTDGLRGVDPAGIDQIIIAGMGGETISSILAAAPWTRAGQIRLLLQPQSKLIEFSRFLYSHGYMVQDCTLCKDDGKLYTIYAVSAGECTGLFSPADHLIHPLFRQKRDPLLPEFTAQQLKKFTRALHGMERAAVPVSPDIICETRDIVKGLYAIEEEIKKW